MEDNKVVAVKDWSQPYKLAVYAIAILGMVAFIYFVVIPWGTEVLSLLRQIAENTSK